MTFQWLEDDRKKTDIFLPVLFDEYARQNHPHRGVSDSEVKNMKRGHVRNYRPESWGASSALHEYLGRYSIHFIAVLFLIQTLLINTARRRRTACVGDYAHKKPREHKTPMPVQRRTIGSSQQKIKLIRHQQTFIFSR